MKYILAIIAVAFLFSTVPSDPTMAWGWHKKYVRCVDRDGNEFWCKRKRHHWRNWRWPDVRWPDVRTYDKTVK